VIVGSTNDVESGVADVDQSGYYGNAGSSDVELPVVEVQLPDVVETISSVETEEIELTQTQEIELTQTQEIELTQTQEIELTLEETIEQEIMNTDNTPVIVEVQEETISEQTSTTTRTQ